MRPSGLLTWGARVLSISDVVAGYGLGTVLHGISLQVNEGQAVAVVGPNGAGKTTLLKCVTGQLRPASGAVTFESENLVGIPTASIVARGISLVPEGRRIYRSLSVKENLLIGGYLIRRGKGRDAEYAKMLDLFPELKKRLNVSGASLSGGEQQMLAIARALMAKPKLLLVDEGSLGLSPLLVERLCDLLKRLRQELGLTLLLVEQGAVVASAVATRTFVMSDGALVEQGSSEYERLAKQYFGEVPT
jgi:branched-chain amino acid transport system ATP-binding protein